MANENVLQDPRFRRAVISGELYRCVSIFLRIQYPDVEDLSTLPHDVRENARALSWNAIHAKLQERKEMEKEMR